tara:strand:+ start:210 stop:869 length:660 start_codon:yes stop_codon:yes gene_type:complete
MEVILLERIEKLGQMGDIVNVKSGYARNYLLPHKKALRASEASRAIFEQQRAQLEAENLKNRQEADRIAKEVDGRTIVIVRQASDSDQLYGSVTTQDIATGITESGVTIDRRQVILSNPIKTVGIHRVRVNLHPEVSFEIVANIARSEEEAEMQARGERINRDGDVIDIVKEEAVEAEALFEEEATPDIEAAEAAPYASTEEVQADDTATSDGADKPAA